MCPDSEQWHTLGVHTDVPNSINHSQRRKLVLAITLFGEPQTIEPCPKICPRTPAGQLAHRLHRLMGDRRGPALPPWSGQVVNHGSQLFTRDAEHHLAAGSADSLPTKAPRSPGSQTRASAVAGAQAPGRSLGPAPETREPAHCPPACSCLRVRGTPGSCTSS